MDKILVPDGGIEDRTSRMSVLSWHQRGGKAFNLFTHIRHRRADGMGPWAGEPDRVWRTTTFPSNETVQQGEIKLHRLDAPLAYCLELVKDILENNVRVVEGHEVSYALEKTARCHWAYRNQMGKDDHSVNSPFASYSAKVTEFWSFEPGPRDYWRRVCESYTSRQLDYALCGQAFRLDRRLDRVGNLMISGAEDEINCELASRRTHLSLKVITADGTGLPENTYFATVWAVDNDNALVHQHLEIAEQHTIVNIDSALDQIGFALYRRSDGQCIDRLEVPLFREIGIEMNLSTGQTLAIHDTRRGTTNTVSIGDAKSVIRVGDENSAALDSRIRGETLGRKTWLQDRDARVQRNLGRFGPDQTEQAIDFFLSLLADTGHSDGPIYLADPYFMQRDFDNTNERVYSSMFSTTKGQQLRILCGQRNVERWLSKYPSILTNHVAVRAVTSKNGKGQDRPAFHDRYLITPDKEIIVTHSINGWHDHGVTFATLSYGVYRAEAEELWSLNAGHNNNGVLVEEIK